MIIMMTKYYKYDWLIRTAVNLNFDNACRSSSFYSFAFLNMSSTPSYSVDSDCSSSDTRYRSLSLSNSSRASDSGIQQTFSPRSQTPKAKRKNVSNRSMPYVSPVLSRANQSENSTITVVNNNQDLGGNIGQSLNNMHTSNITSQQNQLNQEQNAFEISSDDENEVSYFDIIDFFRGLPTIGL